MLNKRGFGALLLVATMIMGMSTTAFAQETTHTPTVGTGTAESPATVSITKDF